MKWEKYFTSLSRLSHKDLRIFIENLCLHATSMSTCVALEKKLSRSVSSNFPSPSDAVAVISASRISYSSWSFDLFVGKDLSCAWEVHENTEGQAPFFNFLFWLEDEMKSSGVKCSEQTFVLSVTLKSFFGSLFIRVTQTLKATTNIKFIMLLAERTL